MQVLLNLLNENWPSLYRGWGYLDDELRSLRQGWENLRRWTPLFDPRPLEGEAREVPVFVVGSGPSLDEGFELLKEYKDKAFVVSCGTALGALLSEGIKPDLHLEVERPLFTRDALLRQVEDLGGKDALRDILFLGLLPIHPEVFALFREKAAVPKPNDLGTYIAGLEERALYFCNPTVTNFGISLSLALGFKRVFLLGVDYGFPSPERHHSKSSLYYKGKLEYSRDDNLFEIRGNLTPKIWTTSLYAFSRAAAQDGIAYYKAPDTGVYNVGDGAYIEGAKPTTAPEGLEILKALRIPSKRLAVEEIRKRMLKIDKTKTFTERARIHILDRYKDIDNFISDLEKRIENVRYSYEILKMLIDLNNFLQADHMRAWSIMFRGTLWHSQTRVLIYYWSFRDKQAHLSEIKEFLRLYLSKLKEILRKTVEELTSYEIFGD